MDSDEIRTKRKYPPSYYRYKLTHKQINLTYDIEEYRAIMDKFGTTENIKQALIDISNGLEFSEDTDKRIKDLEDKYKKSQEINKKLIERLKDD